MRASLFRAGLAGVLGLGLVVTVAPAQAATPAPIRIVDLGTFGGGAAAAHQINDRGQVVGYMQTAAGPIHPFLWQRGVKRDLGTLGGVEGNALDVNERGHIAGNSVTATGERHGFFWRDGRMTDLGTLGGTFSAGLWIDGRDQVFGRSFAADGTNLPFVWRDGVMRPMSAPGWTDLNVSDVSESGYAVGNGINPDGGRQAFRWYRGVLTGLPALEPGTTGQARFVNDRGEVLGLVVGASASRTVIWSRGRVTQVGGESSEPGDLNDLGHVTGQTGDDEQAFLWRCGRLTGLAIAGYTNSRGEFVNNRDDVVVRASRYDEDEGFLERPWFLWRRGTARELEVLAEPGLDTPGGAEVRDINNRGQMVGTAQVADGNPRAVLWNP